MTEEQLKECIHYNDIYESNLALPNDLFKQIQTMVSEGKLKPTHCGFVWSYVYLMTYLFRYAKYDYCYPTVGEIKEILGYNKNNQRLDYIIKQNGLLEQMNILATIHDFPVVVEWMDNDCYEKELTFTYASELYNGVKDYLKERGLSMNYSCKYPVFGFYMNPDNINNEQEYNGTFFYTSNQVILPFDVFNYCMSNDELGANTFYIWSWFKYQNDLFGNEFNTTRYKISKETCLSETTIQRIINNMRSYNMITVHHNMEYFSRGIEKEDRKANTYKVNDYDNFTYKKINYERMRYVSEEEHEEIKKMKSEIDSHDESLFL